MIQRIKVEFLSDWHIGSGAGIPGSVDRQVLRDEEGFPCIPGKTLTGIIRDAAEFVACVRGGKWPEVLAELFGEQPGTHGGAENAEARGAKVGIGSASLSRQVREYLKANDLTQYLFSVQPGIKIDSRTGRTVEDFLFSTEKVRSDCVLYAEVRYLAELSGDEEKLFADALKAVRSIGGRRRRGAGRCRIRPVPHVSIETESTPVHLPSGKPVKLRIRLKTLEPVISASRTLGNAVRSSTEIPGNVMLSYYAGEVLSPLGSERVRAAVMNGEIAAGNALPDFGEGETLPVPLCLAEEKDTHIIINRLVHAPSDSRQLKDIRTGYVTLSGGKASFHPSAGLLTVKTHNTVEDSSQRPSSTAGGLFTYEALKPCSVFSGTLRLSKNLAREVSGNAEILGRLSHGTGTFGRSRKDGYGKAEAECLEVLCDESRTVLSSATYRLRSGRRLLQASPCLLSAGSEDTAYVQAAGNRGTGAGSCQDRH